MGCPSYFELSDQQRLSFEKRFRTRADERSRTCYHLRVSDQQLKWWHVRWRPAVRAISRFAIVSGKVIGALCLLGAIGYGFIYLLSPWLVSHSLRRFNPRLSTVPTDLPTKSQALLSKVTIDRYGFRVTLPDEDIASTYQGRSITTVQFRNGGYLMMPNTARAPGILEFASSDKQAKEWVGQDALRSRFMLMQAAMWTTPEQARWWRFRNAENKRIGYLLVTKLSLLRGPPGPYAFTLGPIYTISAGGFRGFQIGNPDVPPYEAHLDLFDDADRHLEFDVSGSEGHGRVLTQPEINAIVASIRPAPGL